MGYSFRTPDHVIHRARYLYDYYGSWSAVVKRKHPVTGELDSPLPKEIRDRIEADDRCHPPEIQKRRRRAREKEDARKHRREFLAKLSKWMKGRNAR